MFFFFNDTATTEIYTLSLHDALPISPRCRSRPAATYRRFVRLALGPARRDRKSTRLNSSHGYISYAVFCLKKKKMKQRALYASRKKDTITTYHSRHRISRKASRHVPV